jgi:hypothetical protein
MQDSKSSICWLLLLLKALLLFLEAVVRLLRFAVSAAAAVVVWSLLGLSCPHPCVIRSRQDHALRHLTATTWGGSTAHALTLAVCRLALLTRLLGRLHLLPLLLLLLWRDSAL